MRGVWIQLVAAICVALVAGCAEPESTMDARWPIDPATGLRIPALPPVPDLPEWEDNPSNEAKLRLGIALFNDVRISGSGKATCANCHLPASSFQSNAVTDLPDRSYPHMEPVLIRTTPSLLNLVHAPVFHWDGKEPYDFYDLMSVPLAEPNMNLTDHPSEEIWLIDRDQAKPNLYKKLTLEVPEYIPWFEEAFGVNLVDLNPDEVWTLTGKALAIYMRDVISTDSDFDRWNAGDNSAMNEQQLRGMESFIDMERGACIACHNGPLFSDFQFHNLSLELPDEQGNIADEGRARVTGDPADVGSFLTPMLRDVTRTAPYFHHGRAPTLMDVLDHHLGPNSKLDPLHDPFLDHMNDLSFEEKKDIIAFLTTLQGAPLPRSHTSVLVELP